MPTFWTGTGKEFTTGTSSADLSDTLTETNFGPNVQSGDTIVRWLLQWYLITALVDNSSGLENQPMPWVAGVYFTPNPSSFASEGDSLDLSIAEVADAIYTERTFWLPTRWTDGTLHATQWVAGSRGVIDIGAERTFHDHSTDRVHFGVQALLTDFSSEPIDMTLAGWFKIKVLIKR